MAGLKIFLIVGLLIVQIEFVENCVRWEGLKAVSSCPKNQAEWEEAAKRKNCRNLQERENCENATYHCLVDSSRTALVEVCTVPRNLNGYCPLFYETDLPFVRNDYRRDCSKYDNESSCASFYSSTDAYKYQACYNISTDQTKVSSTVPQQTTVGSPAKTTSVVETELTTKVNTRGGLGGTEDKGNNTWIIGVVIFILILLIVLVYIGTVIYQWKCKEKTFRQALCFCCNALCNWFRDRKRRENNEDAHIELGQGTPDQEDAPLLLSESGIKNDSVMEGKGHQMEQTRHPESNGTSHECSEDTTDVKREDALRVDVSADSVMEGKGHQMEQTRHPESNGTSHECSEDTTDVKREDALKVDVSADSVMEGKGHQMEQTRHPESNGTSHECSEDTTDVKREDALKVDVSADSVMEGKGHQMEQTRHPESNGTSHECSEDTTDVKREDALKVDVSADSVMEGKGHQMEQTRHPESNGTSHECSEDTTDVKREDALRVDVSADSVMEGKGHQMEQTRHPESNGTSHECSEDTTDVKREDALRVDVSADSVMEGKGHQMEQTRHPESNGTSHECSEDTTDVKREDALKVDVSAVLRITETEPKAGVLDFPGVVSIKKGKDLGHTVPLGNMNTQWKLNTKSELSFTERISNIIGGHDEIEERLKNLQRQQFGPPGEVHFLELTVECLEKILCELEKGYGLSESKCHQTRGHGNVRERVTQLQNRVSTLINNIEKAEPHILSSTLPNSSAALLESQDKRDKVEKCNNNLPEAIERLQDPMPKIKQRLFDLNKAGLGINGSIKALRERIQCTENMIKLLENNSRLSRDTIPLIPNTASNPDQLDNLDKILSDYYRRLRHLESLNC